MALLDHNSENARARELFHAHQLAVYQQTDRVFAILMPVQWLAGILAAWFVSPLTWRGVESRIHIHIWAAILLGGTITLLPMIMVLRRPGALLTRYIVAISQMLMTGLLIHLSGGRIETHFHVFGSLAFLAFYRDWRVLIPASLVTAGDHLVRGWFYPMSMYGVLSGGEWRWIEHACWVIFIDIFLIASCRRSAQEMLDIARRTAELDASEERYRAVIEQTSEGIALLDPDTLRIIECNEAFSRLVGCQSIAETARLTIVDFSNLDQAEIRLLAANGQEQQGLITHEKTFYCLNGDSRPVDVNVNVISYNNRQAYCVTVKDISDRKRTEAELQRLALVAQKTKNAVLIYDTQGILRWVNEGFTRISGYEREEVIGIDPWNMFCGPDTDSQMLRKLHQAVVARKSFEGEIYQYGKDGRSCWLSLSVMPLHNQQDELQGFFAIAVDITERKMMEEQLRQAHSEMERRVVARTEELLQANRAMQLEVNERKRAEAELKTAQQFLHKVIENVPSHIFVKDMEGRFVLANNAVAETYGTTIEQLIGKTDADCNVNADDVERIRQDDLQVLRTLQEKFIPEEKVTTAAGETRWLQTIKRPVSLDATGVVYLLGVATDLTERKALGNQLRHAQKMESIGQLAAGIAHEINTPTQYVGDNTRFVRDSFSDLETIWGKFSELLASARSGFTPPALLAQVEKEMEAADVDYLLEEIPHALQQSLEGVTRIAKIVQAMKDFAHPGSNEKKAADLNRAIESTITVARNEWKYVADVETHFDETLPLVPCLLGEFNQVILNMTINASHAIADVVGDGAKGKGKITITTANIANEWAEIRISDTGTGIPPHVRRRIFDPFFTTKDVGKGTGQGLAISHHVIVEKHKGQLSFETEMGQGTTFILRLPLIEPVPEPAAIALG